MTILLNLASSVGTPTDRHHRLLAVLAMLSRSLYLSSTSRWRMDQQNTSSARTEMERRPQLPVANERAARKSVGM